MNEIGTIAGVIGEIPADFSRDIIVADSGSTDGTQQAAIAAGARVVDADRGYGRACAMAAASADPPCKVIVFLDGEGADRADLVGLIAGPVLRGSHDFVLASRTRGVREPGSMLWHQVLAGRAAGFGIGMLSHMRYSDSNRRFCPPPGAHSVLMFGLVHRYGEHLYHEGCRNVAHAHHVTPPLRVHSVAAGWSKLRLVA